MHYPNYLIWLYVFFGGSYVNSLKKLSHVTEYQTITPQKLHKLSQTSTEQKKNPDIVTYSLTIAGQNRTLHLERNIDLIGGHFSVVHYSDQGTEETTTPDYKDHCYYHGHIVEVEDSSASIDLCSGINGHVRIGDQSYLIEPLAKDSETDWRAGTEEGEGLHAVYGSQHLRQKRSTCGQGDGDVVFDHGSRPAAMFQPSNPQTARLSKFQSGRTRTVEMVLVVDNAEYKKYGSTVTARMLAVVNHVDKLYRALGIRVMLVGLEIWTYRDQIDVSSDPDVTLDRFMIWRQSTLLQKIKHDNAQFITKVDFIGDTVGLAFTSAMCTGRSGAVNEDHNNNAMGVATTLAHELGHNLGLSHDVEGCVCRSPTPRSGCIMSATHGSVYPEVLSSCSLVQLAQFLEQANPACILNMPSTDRIIGGPVCGNAFLEPGEECDCGTVSECNNRCCNATTCKLNTGAKCAEGECCHDCQMKQTGTLCRARAGDCDLAEHCTGFSADCPKDAYAENGLLCHWGSGYCLNGQCPSQDQHCKRLWGPDARNAAEACYRDFYRYPICGKLLCTGGKEYPLTMSKRFHTLANGVLCNEASTKSEDNYPADITMIPTGTKCGDSMVCYQQRCQSMKGVKALYGTEGCGDKCNNRGVCNHEGQCHCEPGWAAPYCDKKLSEVSAGPAFSVAIALSLAALLILLFVGIFGGLMWRKMSRDSQKRPRITSTGESNPVFQSGSVQSSPRLWPPLIGQPKFVESTASQVCQPESQPLARKILPSRAAPVPPKKMVPSQGIDLKDKPPPPARPLPPLQSKMVTKPKPPVPPTKPSGSPSPGKHNDLSAARAALKPPTQLR